MVTSVHVGIVDGNPFFRKTLKTFLLEQPQVRVLLETADASGLLNRLRDLSVQVLLMDVFFSECDGLQLLQAIRSGYPCIKILVLSTLRDMHLISELLDAGVHGFISKEEDPEGLVLALQAVSSGQIFRNKLYTDALYWSKQNDIRPSREGTTITLNDREKRILQLLWEEKSTKEIADELFLGTRSVEKIRQELKEKTGVKSVAGLLKYALNKRIIRIGAPYMESGGFV